MTFTTAFPRGLFAETHAAATKAVLPGVRVLGGQWVTLEAMTIRSTICALLLLRRPAAISGLVVTVSVDAIEGHALRALTHVFEKVRELLPPLADRDASPAVIGISRDIRVANSSEHGCPAPIGGRLPAKRSMSMSVIGIRLIRHLELILSGVAPRGVRSTAEASLCLQFIRCEVRS